MAIGYEHVITGASTTPAAPYDNLMTTPPFEQNPEADQHMGSGLNDHFNGKRSYDNTGEQIHSNEEIIRVHDSTEITTHSDANDVSGTSERIGQFGESGETTLFDNVLYGDNASNVHRSNKDNANEGERTVIDNDFYE